jgi:hypothetical protein
MLTICLPNMFIALKRESLHFKLRVCDLLETLLKRLPHIPPVTDGLPMSFRLYLPLLDALANSSEQPMLNKRLTSLYKDQLCKPALIPDIIYAPVEKKIKKSKREAKDAEPEVPLSGVPVGNIRIIMSALLSRAQRTKERDVLAVISHALLFLTRVTTPFYGVYRKESTPSKKTKTTKDTNGSSTAATEASTSLTATANDEEQGAFVIELYRGALTEYLGKKHTLWNTKFFVDFIERCRVLAWRLAPTLVR